MAWSQPAPKPAQPTRFNLAKWQQLKEHARERLGLLHERGVEEARLYGVDDAILEGGLNSCFLLLDEPEVYNLPSNPPRPSNNVAPGLALDNRGSHDPGAILALFSLEKSKLRGEGFVHAARNVYERYRT